MLINGTDLAVEVHGQGPAVVMVPGLGGASSVFEPQASVLAERFTVIRPDPRGTGRSPLDGPVSVASHVDDLVAVLDALGVGSAHLVGHSLGSLTVRHLAVRHRARTLSVVLIAPVAAPIDGGVRLRSRAQALRDRGAEAVVPEIVAASTSPRTRTERPEIAAFVRALLMSQDPQSYACNYEVLADAPDPEPLPAAIPALVIGGEDDAVGPPSVARAVASQCGRAQLTIIPRCGHWPMVEATSATTAALTAFLATGSPEGT